MAVDPQDPDTFDEPADGTGPDAGKSAAATPADPDGETPEADAAEQRAEVQRTETDEEEVPPSDRQSGEVDPADAADQARVVEQNEDEYR